MIDWWFLVVNSCQKIQCLNDGTCYENSPGFASCLCKNGYTGKFCEIGKWIIFGLN